MLTTFGKYLNKNILCIPKNVLLPEDKVIGGKEHVFLGTKTHIFEIEIVKV